MPFDMGFDFRGTLGGASDPSFAVAVLAETYPHTYTNSDGASINAGWEDGSRSADDRWPSNDPRLVGGNGGGNNEGGHTFTIKLDTGSAPGAGTYDVDLALGDGKTWWTNQSITVKDNTSPVLALTNGGTGYSFSNDNEYQDATDTLRTATTTWNGVTAPVTFASTTCVVLLDSVGAASGATRIAHFRLTLQAGGGQSVVPVLMAHYRQRGS
jgi:hypothetical protein